MTITAVFSQNVLVKTIALLYYMNTIPAHGLFINMEVFIINASSNTLGSNLSKE